MPEDYEGTPSLEAPEVDSEPQDSPDYDDDTPDTSDSSEKGGTDDVASLRQELEDLRKRVSGQTQSWQQERDKRLLYEKRLERWKQAGLNPDEIDRAVESSLAALSGGQQTPAQQGQMPPGVVSREELQSTLANQRYIAQCESAAEKYFTKNPEDDTPLIRRQVTDIATRLAREELAMNAGVITSTPEQLMKGAFKELQELKNQVAKRVQKSMTETREKVKGQGVTDTQHRKQKPSAESDEDRPMTDDEYVSLFRGHQQRLKSRK